MIHAKKFLSRLLESKRIGPGGWDCPCCAPAPGEPRKKFVRDSKRGWEKKYFDDYIKSELENASD